MENVWFAPLCPFYFPGLKIKIHQFLAWQGHLVWIVIVFGTMYVRFDILPFLFNAKIYCSHYNVMLILVNVMHSQHIIPSFYTTKFLSAPYKHRKVRDTYI